MKKIFISLASYRDPMLFFTLESAYSHAVHPENIVFGIVDQNEVNQRHEMEKLPFFAQIRYCHLYPEDTLGVSWARSIAYSLYNDEEYILQIDSHTCFEEGWDENLIDQLNEQKNVSLKPIITTYPYPFTFDEKRPKYNKPEGKTVLVLRPKPDQILSKENPILTFRAEHLFTDTPVLGCHIAGGFFFCEGQFVEEIPYDPYMYFHGEEQNLSLRAFTRGWDIYHPKWIPLYHLYKEANQPHDTHHWYGEVLSKRDFDSSLLRSRAQARLKKLISGELGESAYGLGSVRSLDDFALLSGINYSHAIIKDVHGGLLR